MSTAIVGAGVAGLSLALMLEDEVTVFEKSDVAGGLCRSTETQGFTFDLGPHVLGGVPEAVAWVKSSTGLRFTEGKTNNTGWLMRKGFVAHPFENEQMGLNYMSKMWKTDPEEMDGASLTVQPGRKPGGVNTFSYPESGGYQAITDSWAKQLEGKIRYGQTIRTRKQFDHFDRVVWTAPRLGRYNSLYVETICLEGEAPRYTAVYLPENPKTFHRLSFPSVIAPQNAPEGCFSVQGEFSMAFPGKHPDDLYKLCQSLGLIESPRQVLKHTRLVSHAYPVCVETPPAPESERLFFHGRTGAHVYKNLDGVVADSISLAARMNA